MIFSIIYTYMYVILHNNKLIYYIYLTFTAMEITITYYSSARVFSLISSIFSKLVYIDLNRSLYLQDLPTW